MSCMCAGKLADLLKALLSLKPSPISLPVSLQALASMPLGGGGAAASSLNLSASLPPLGLSAMTLAQLSATANAAASVQAGLGVDLTAPGASAQLSAAIGAANANLFAFLPFGGLDATPFLALSTLGALAMSCKAAFGIDLMGSGGPAGLSAALSASVAAPAPPLPANVGAYASLASTSASLGVDISQPGAMEALAANASAVASLSIPAIGISPALLLNPLAILAALANIIAGLGLNPFAPGFTEASAAISAKLPAFAGLAIPASFSAGSASGRTWVRSRGWT